MLTFDHPAQFESPIRWKELQGIYTNMLTNELSKLGVQVEHLDISPNEFSPSLLHINIRNWSLPADQRKVMKNYLAAIHEERNRSISISWRLNTTAALMEGIVPSQSLSSGKASFKYMHITTESSRYIRMPNGQDDSGCFAFAKFDSPFEPHVDEIKILAKPVTIDNETANAEVTLGAMGRFGVFGVVSTLELGDARILELLAQNKIRMVLDSTRLEQPFGYFGSDSRISAIQEAVFVLAPHAEPQVTSELFLHVFKDEKKAACQQLAMSYGRPFSFYSGISMDRLREVQFF